jgi:hypothetical protein
MGIQRAKNTRYLVSWEKICKPKKQGGLGVLNLRIQNQALLNLYKFYNHMDIPWVNLIWRAYYSNGEAPHAMNPQVSFWWRDCMSLNENFRNITTCSINSGHCLGDPGQASHAFYRTSTKRTPGRFQASSRPDATLRGCELNTL